VEDNEDRLSKSTTFASEHPTILQKQNKKLVAQFQTYWLKQRPQESKHCCKTMT
jgi:hypothetical protein